MKRIILAVLISMLISGCMPHITMADDLCVQFKVSWNTPDPTPPATICVCAADVFVGLEAALSTMVSVPPNIEISGAMTPKECEKKEPIGNTPEDVKALLEN